MNDVSIVDRSEKVERFLGYYSESQCLQDWTLCQKTYQRSDRKDFAINVSKY